MSLAEFAAPAEARRPIVTGDASPADPPAASATVDAESANGGVRLVHQKPHAANSRETAPQILRRPGDRVVVEGLVGQVNGRPIYADEFFEPIEDRILAARREMPPDDFATALQIGITQHLREIVDTELVIAETESQFSPEQQQGVFAWLRNLQETTIAELGGGTRKATEARILESQGLSLEDYLRDKKEKALIQMFMMRKVAPRVIVSWRDVEIEYQRHIDEFKPPSTLTLARISVATDEGPERIDEIETRLASGEDFAAVAESLGFENGGRLLPKPIGPNGITDIPYDEAIKSQVAKLKPGERSPPFQMGSSTWWISVVSIDHPPQLDIHDFKVQRLLTEAIRRQREEAEINRYLAMLRERWVADDLETMRQRLLAIARDRYLR